MTVERVGDFDGLLLRGLTYGFATRLVLVAVRHRDQQVVHAVHDARLDDVAVDRIAPAEGSARLDLQATTPSRVIGIDLVTEGRSAVLSEEDRALDLVRLPLAFLDLESMALEARP